MKYSTATISDEVLDAVLKSIDEAIHVVDPNGVTIFYNEVAAKHDGLEVSEVLGKPLLTVFPSLTEQSSTLLKAMKTKRPIYNMPQSFTNLHGKKIETINTSLPIFVDGKMVGAVEIAKDYSQIKQLSERLLDLHKNTPKKHRKSSNHQAKYYFQDLFTINSKFRKTIQKAEKLAKSDSPILVFGESGTGKELFVQSIHNASSRAKGPFIPQNCAAIPETLLESILFGTSKGSYTGAIDRPGLFELANGGTLFLDELHAMPSDLQAKLLRVLEDGNIRRIGSSTVQSVDVRVISAMNMMPDSALNQGTLRKDLFYRLNVLTFELIPLRQRKEDILFLAELFINEFNGKLHKKITGIDPIVQTVFLTHSWPGNIRELKHCIEYMMNVCEGTKLKENDLPVIFHHKVHEESRSSYMLKEQLHKLEKELIIDALKTCGGNVQKAADLLEIPRQTLQYKMKKWNIHAAEY